MKELVAVSQAHLEGRPIPHPRAPNLTRIREQWDKIKAAAKSESASFAAAGKDA